MSDALQASELLLKQLDALNETLKKQPVRGSSNAENHFHFGGAFSALAVGMSIAAIVGCAATWVRVEIAEATHDQRIDRHASDSTNRETAWRQLWADKVDKFIRSKEGEQK